MFGSVDYAVEMCSQPNEKLFAYPRSRLVVASAAAGLAAPVDGPTPMLNDAAALIEQTMTAIQFGMGGKLCIHPDQIARVAPLFLSTKDEEWAQKVLNAYRDSKSGVFVLNGEMIDAPQLALARKILE
jgi:citrate lyase subunit beta/citryl-CoA lyase